MDRATIPPVWGIQCNMDRATIPPVWGIQSNTDRATTPSIWGIKSNMDRATTPSIWGPKPHGLVWLLQSEILSSPASVPLMQIPLPPSARFKGQGHSEDPAVSGSQTLTTSSGKSQCAIPRVPQQKNRRQSAAARDDPCLAALRNCQALWAIFRCLTAPLTAS